MVALAAVVIMGFVVQRAWGVIFGSEIDMGNARIINLGTALESEDAVSWSFLEAVLPWQTRDGTTDLYYNSGDVGIGTDAPDAKLEVVGGVIKATDGLIIESRTSDPAGAETGRIWIRTDL